MNYFKKLDRLVGWLVFAVAAIVYLLTIEPTTSLWDCAEFTATSYKLEVGHPPGAPLFMMIARFFTLFAGAEHAAAMVNSMSAIASAFTILFMFWSITHLGRRIITLRRGQEPTVADTWTVMAAGAIGALAYTFTDTFWFSAVESEVYALSSLFTAIVVWAMLKWEETADEPHANRWLVLIAYLMGLSIGVHLLSLLAIPAIVFIYYFRTSNKVTFRGIVKATAAAAAILLFINNIIIPYTVAAGAVVDRWFVNGLGLPVNSGLAVFVILLLAILGGAVYLTHRHGKVVWNTILLCTTVVLLGFCTYASVVIRAAANPPMNSNDPDNAYGLLYLLNRDQYGSKPLLFGAQYPAPLEDVVYGNKYYINEEGKYQASESIVDYKYPSQFVTFFPRMWSTSPLHIEGYKQWGGIDKGRAVYYEGQRYEMPTSAQNLRYFMDYQLNFMYWRYFLWNFVGRQSDVQSYGEITDGQWLSGIKPIDALYLGPQEGLPSEMADNKGRNTYYFLPFLLGLIGLIYQLNRDTRNFTVVMWLFVMMGIMLVLYFNINPSEPRERDYIYAGSFYAFSIWIGLGVMCVREWMEKLFRRRNVLPVAAAAAVCCSVPVVLGAENWDDHDRSGRYMARDLGYNHLMTCLPNSIILNFGDNDTFPLWYNQEVEGVRPDVRIMNTSYLDGGWYVDEMKYRYNESAPVPFSLPKHKYAMSENDFIYVEDVFQEPKTISQVIDFIRSDAPISRIQLTEKTSVDFIPTRTILLPVNKENAVRSGIVKPEDAHLMVDTITINLQGSSLRKSEMMILDLLANFDWERPLFFTSLSVPSSIGLADYLQFDGFAYRLVPIYTPSTDVWYTGRIDEEVLYNNLMNVYRYGNLADSDVYVDYTTSYNVDGTRVRLAFARLADALTAKGETERAIEVLDYGLQQLPVSQFRFTVQYLPYIRAYYEAGAMDKGDALFDSYEAAMEEYVDYFLSFPLRKQYLVEEQLSEKLAILAELHGIAEAYGRTDRAERILSLFDWVFGPDYGSASATDKSAAAEEVMPS